jgi:hypothetical protein
MYLKLSLSARDVGGACAKTDWSLWLDETSCTPHGHRPAFNTAARLTPAPISEMAIRSPYNQN